MPSACPSENISVGSTGRQWDSTGRANACRSTAQLRAPIHRVLRAAPTPCSARVDRPAPRDPAPVVMTKGKRCSPPYPFFAALGRDFKTYVLAFSGADSCPHSRPLRARLAEGRGSTTVTAPMRLTWPNCLNVRDLGGLPTSDGRQIGSGALIRSDNLSRLTEAVF